MAVFSVIAPFKPEFRMTAARPVDEQNNLSAILIGVSNDLPNEDSDDSLLQSHVRLGRVPNRWQVLRQAHENLRIRQGRRWTLAVGLMQLNFKVLYLLQRNVPSRLELFRHQSLLGIYGFVSPRCEARFVAGLFDLQFDRLAQLLLLLLNLRGSLHGGFDRVPFDGAQHLLRYALVDPQATKGDATAFPAIEPSPTALIANHDSSWSRVNHVQHSSATPAAQKAWKQSPAAAAGLRSRTRMAKAVSGNHRLIPFVFLPWNVAGMMISNQDHPFGSRFGMA